jgi:hypothetical protein
VGGAGRTKRRRSAHTELHAPSTSNTQIEVKKPITVQYHEL